MSIDRRRWIETWRGELESRRAPKVVDAEARVVLLGTAGGSNPKATRCGYSNAVVVGDAVYVVDCGEGVHTQLHRAGLGVSSRFGKRPVVTAICLTHLHADHLMDLPNLLQGSWPANAIDIYGPGPAGPPFTTYDDPVHPLRFGDDPAPGTRRVLEHFTRAFATNINARIIGERRADYIDHISVHEIGLASELAASGEADPLDIAIPIEIERSAADFEVPTVAPFVVRPCDANGVTITATLVQHAPVFPALAYRFDTPFGSVVFSGDTGPCDNVVRLATGAGLLVHEVIDLEALFGPLPRLPNYETVRTQLGRSHTPIDSVGAIAARAGVGTLVLSHLVPGERSHTPEEWEALARAAAPEFGGDVVCAVDLDEIALG